MPTDHRLKKLVSKKEKTKRAYISQSESPRHTLEDALRLPQALADNFGGKPTAPYQVAMALDISPTSTTWQTLSGASVAYGLTDGGYNAGLISLTDLGRRIVLPTEEGDDARAKIEAILRPRVSKAFFSQYDRNKFPQDKIALNVLGTMGIARERVNETFSILRKNGEFTGILHQTKTGLFVGLGEPRSSALDGKETDSQASLVTGVNSGSEPALAPMIAVESAHKSQVGVVTNQKVFITHGKNKEIVDQLKNLLVFGKFMPIVAEEHETISKPVPEKVMEDMRACFAGVIHIASEDKLLDERGVAHHKINENVLIEIGAAMALYGKNFILLVQKGIHLPSNLQGLYRCEYEGEKLDYDATMKLLKAFTDFR